MFDRRRYYQNKNRERRMRLIAEGKITPKRHYLDPANDASFIEPWIVFHARKVAERKAKREEAGQ